MKRIALVLALLMTVGTPATSADTVCTLSSSVTSSTWDQIAQRFNVMKVPTARGGKWYGQTVLNAAKRL